MIYIPLWLKVSLLWKQKALFQGKTAIFVLFIKVPVPKRRGALLSSVTKKPL